MFLTNFVKDLKSKHITKKKMLPLIFFNNSIGNFLSNPSINQN